MVVGCKSDKGYTHRKDEEMNAQKIMNQEWKKLKILAFECSSETGDNVKNLFVTAAELVLQRRLNEICIGLLKEWKLDEYIDELIHDGGYNHVQHWGDLELDDLKELGFKTVKARKFIRKAKEYLQQQ